MPTDDELEQLRHRLEQLDRYELIYQQTHNDVVVWLALAVCVDLLLTGFEDFGQIRPWMRPPLSQMLGELRSFFDNPDDVTTKQYAQAFGYKRFGRGVRRTGLVEYEKARVDELYASIVRKTKQRDPSLSLEAIIAHVAAKHGVNETRIWEAWHAWKDFPDFHIGFP